MNKGLTLKTGQTHVHKYSKKLLQMIEEGAIDPSAIITHRLPLTTAQKPIKLSATRKTVASK